MASLSSCWQMRQNLKQMKELSENKMKSALSERTMDFCKAVSVAEYPDLRET